jgi:hypothetical protein
LLQSSAIVGSIATHTDSFLQNILKFLYQCSFIFRSHSREHRSFLNKTVHCMGIVLSYENFESFTCACNFDAFIFIVPWQTIFWDYSLLVGAFPVDLALVINICYHTFFFSV